ncbi:dehydrogenase/reductase SDR family member 4-like [Xenia sp. Carnegie-2017]|uniref:dehydrogenase/reductase SDR family member 4-like n=1 Tax=Xenia sp. Carnegie-2017 TaxID=2897299 RepID=UPI001F03B0E5|nr:dehydrogenase/reductase SDR family member 4-like [Xenia sp. Carnegie-2017]
MVYPTLKTGEMFSKRSLVHTGKVAIVTASTDGIGLAIARRLGEDGAQVVISSRQQNNVDSACKKLRDEGIDVFGTVCHVSKPEDRKNLVKKTMERFGRIDVFVSNAAVNPFIGRTLDISEEAFDKIFETNVKSSFLLVKEIVPYMQSQKSKGSIVFVSSIAGFTPINDLGAYSVSKTALIALTNVLAKELGPDGIRVNCIAPGVIKTKFSQKFWDNDDLSKEMKKHIPLKRFGTPEECAGLVSFLSSSDASYITGESITISGGVFCRL